MPGAAPSKEREVLRQVRRIGLQWREEAEAAARQLTELTLLWRQTAAEVDRLGPRSKQAGQRLRDMETHIESYSRADIKEIYAAAQEAQMRLFMMQLQQEQLENKQKVLNTHRDALTQIAALAEQLPDNKTQDEGQSEENAQVMDSTREWAARLIQSQEAERRRVSRQIHDGPAQAMANLVLRAEICEHLMERDPGNARKELAELKKLITDSLQETRRFIFDLRPMILDDLGLAPTLRRYCELLADSSEAPVSLSISGTERRVAAQTEISLFRVAQEAVHNALAHGHPRRVQVTLEYQPEAVGITVVDDGQGCDAGAVMAAARRRQDGGLVRMEQYAESINGQLTFESELGQGCGVSVTVPAA